MFYSYLFCYEPEACVSILNHRRKLQACCLVTFKLTFFFGLSGEWRRKQQVYFDNQRLVMFFDLGPRVNAQDLTEDEEAEAVDEDGVDDVTAEDEDDEAEVEDDENAELVSH